MLSLKQSAAVLCLSCATLTAAAEVDPQNQQSGASQRQMLQHLAREVLLPLTADFAGTSRNLHLSSLAYCRGAQDLPAVQQAWQQAASAWQALEALQIGPTIERRTQRHVNAWPVRPHLLAPLMTPAGATADQVERLGVSAKGLPALEYLLYSDGQDDLEPAQRPLPANSAPVGNDTTPTAIPHPPLARKHCNLLQLLAAQLQQEASQLAHDWRQPNGGFARVLAEAGADASMPLGSGKSANTQASPAMSAMSAMPDSAASATTSTAAAAADQHFSSIEQATSDIVNLLIAGLDMVNLRKLGKPLEASDAAGVRERTESWRSGSSLDHVRDNLRGFGLVFFGVKSPDREDGTSIGLDDYLVRIERPGLARIVREQLNLIRQTLGTLEQPLPRAIADQRAQVELLHTQIKRLQFLMETEVAPALSVDLGFNANDGD